MNKVETVFRYHELTKHHFNRYAPSLGYLDWANQPDPFRVFPGARKVLLPRGAGTEATGIPYDTLFGSARLPAQVVAVDSIGAFFFHSLALSAWKNAGSARWALRVNPSSGNLHPTEAYLVCGPVAGLSGQGAVSHYSPLDHSLEVRAEFGAELERELLGGLPAGTFLVGLSSIPWREAWKYGERAFRYCQHDVGHAIAALALSAAAQGWSLVLLDPVPSGSLSVLLGLRQPLPEPRDRETADCLLAVVPGAVTGVPMGVPASAILERFGALEWKGTPNGLSEGYVDWDGIREVSEAVELTEAESRNPGHYVFPSGAPRPEPFPTCSISFQTLVRRRRSAVDFDGRTRLSSAWFFRILEGTLPLPGSPPWRALPWEPRVSLLLFVHRIDGMNPGIHFLARHPSHLERLRARTAGLGYAWKRVGAAPAHLDLHELVVADAREAAAVLSCRQEIAADSCFSLGMVAEFEPALKRGGAWLYPRLYWECGVLGQMLYLEAEAAGVRGTGIGCFFDNPVNQLLGLDEVPEFQSLYHFTVGGAVEDSRLSTLPAYE